MRIDIKDEQGKPRLTVHLDPSHPPTVVKADDGRGPAVTLDWDQALDDKGFLRHCPVCSCPEFYLRKQVPQLTVFALIVAAAVLAMVLFGYGQSGPALIVLGLVLAFDILIWLFAERVLICYRCQSEFRQTPLKPTDRGWDSNLAERYRPAAKAHPPAAAEPTETEPDASPGTEADRRDAARGEAS
ncbi:MAG: hypothetical protein AAGG38_07460 [Planctomycetota bacterium]